MPIDREALARRKASSATAAAVLGTRPSDEFGSLRLVWECVDCDESGAPTAYACDQIGDFQVVPFQRSWVIVNDRGMHLTSRYSRPRTFRTARAAAKFIEDVLHPEASA